MRTPRLTRQTAIGIAVGCGLLAAILILVYLRGAKPAPPPPVPDVDVVVPARDIPAKTVVTSELLTTRKMKPTEVPKGAARDAKELVGLVAVQTLPANTPVRRSQLVSRGAAGLSGMVPSGMRAVTVAIDPITGVGGLLKAGDRVDVIATYEVEDTTVANTLLQDVELLALGGQTVATTRREQRSRASDEASASKQAKSAKDGKDAKDAKSGGDAPSDAGEGAPEDVEPQPEDYAHATLAVTPDEVLRIMAVKDRARLSLALRPVGEQDIVVVQSQRLSDVAGPAYQQIVRKAEAQKAAAAPKPAVPAPAQPAIPTPPTISQPAVSSGPPAPPKKPEPPAVEVIRGSDRQELVP